nr:hypothetical protein [Alkalisalibacterium limincola]
MPLPRQGDPGACRGHAGIGLRQGQAVVGVVELQQQVALGHRRPDIGMDALDTCADVGGQFALVAGLDAGRCADAPRLQHLLQRLDLDFGGTRCVLPGFIATPLATGDQQYDEKYARNAAVVRHGRVRRGCRIESPEL